MKKFFKGFNWSNSILLILFIVSVCVELDKEYYAMAYFDGFMAILNMFFILVFNQRTIMYEQEIQKEREEKIIEMLKEKGE